MTKKIDDNTIRYCLYPNLKDDNDYENYLNNCLGKLANYLTNYYWYYTSFNLKFIDKQFSHSKVSHIEGCTNFDENIEDEWFIVFLLIELTKLDNELIIEVEDSDGYFLLIESADYLPKWVNSKTSLNRCFLFRGKLHLIEPNKNELNKTSLNSKIKIEPPTIEDALKIIRDEQIKTECSNDIQNQILYRINDYPSKLNKLLHKSIVRIPTSIAYLLNRQPKLITHSIRAFYNRDNLDISICRLMKIFHSKYLVKRIIKIPKFNYAQLIGQNFKPDSKLNWYDLNNSFNSDCSINNNNINSSTSSNNNNNSKITSNTTTTSLKTSSSLPLTIFEKNEIDRQYDLGFKISCGFEILISTFKSTINNIKTESTLSSLNTTSISDQLSRQSTKWLLFLNILKKNNYFNNLIENSIEYENKLKEAKEYYENSILVDFNSEGAFIEYKEIGKLINDLLNDNFIDNELEYFNKFKNEELNISINDQDSDQWLNELPDFILNDNQFMKDNYSELPNKISNNLQKFINSNSDYKGVELENHLIENSENFDNFDNLISNSETSDNLIENPKKRKSDLKERALKMMSDNLRSIITMKIDSDTDHTETDLSDYDYSDNSSNEDLNDINELKYLKQNLKNKQNKKYRDVNERKRRKKSKNTDKEMKKIMNEMDKELSTTTIGKTFDKLSLNKTTIEKSTIKSTNVPMANCAEFDDDEEEDYLTDDERATLNENDIKFNTVKNLLDSFKEQNGLSGPTSNLLNSLGVNLPKDLDD